MLEMKVRTFGMAKAVSVFVPHPPCPRSSGRMSPLCQGGGWRGGSLHVELFLRRQEMQGCMWIGSESFLRVVPVFQAFLLSWLTSRVLCIGHQGRWPASCGCAGFVGMQQLCPFCSDNICSVRAEAWWWLCWNWGMAQRC